MTDAAMTVGALNRIAVAVQIGAFVKLALMAVYAGPVCNREIALVNLNGIDEAAGRKRERMLPAVFEFAEIFSDETGRSMTVVAARDVLMAAGDPAVVLFLHDMAVRAGGGIVR